MFKHFIAILILCLLSACSLVHKPEVEQGNFSLSKVNELHTGMTVSQVKGIMGEPILTNLFTPNRMEYIYTLQKGNDKRIEKRVSLLFQQGHLVQINTQ